MDVSLCVCCLCPQRLEGSIDLLELELQRVVIFHVGNWEPHLGPLQEQQDLSTTEWSAKPIFSLL